ncbi:MAG: hypothetical protein GXP33_02335 [Spirochaetes bacterium]|nr:hypothetical protein [Spirochaetota bacterium]
MSARKSSIVILSFLIFMRPLFSDTFSFKGDKLETVLAQGKERTVLTGNVEIISDENIITADRVELYGKDFNFVRCSGNVDVKNAKRGIHLISDNLFYNRKEKVIRVQGKVVMEDKKNEIVAKGGFLEDWENDDITIIQIGVRILKKDLVCRSEFARYLRKENKLELSGMPVVFWKGDEYRASKIFINLDTNEIKLIGEIKGKIVSENE